MAQADIYRRTLAESLKELLERESIEKITVDEICEKAEISRRSFYRYFIDKYDVVSWIVDREKKLIFSGDQLLNGVASIVRDSGSYPDALAQEMAEEAGLVIDVME